MFQEIESNALEIVRFLKNQQKSIRLKFAIIIVDETDIQPWDTQEDCKVYVLT